VAAIISIIPIFSQSFNLSIIQSFNHSIISIIQSFNLSIFQSFNLSIFQSFNLSIFQSFNHSIFQSFNHFNHSIISISSQSFDHSDPIHNLICPEGPALFP